MGQSVVRALDGVDFNLYEGEYVTIVGTSGSGKSTLMNVIGCLDNLSQGDIFLEGKNLSKCNDSQISNLRNKFFGFIFQQFNLLNHLTVVDNIALPLVYSGITRQKRYEIAKHCACQVGLGDRLEHRPHELSGGQAQRVAIARALANKPRILLADEPTGNLDSKTSKEIIELLEKLNKNGLTLLMVTHDMDIAQQSSRMVVVKDGRIVEQKRLNQINSCTKDVGEKEIRFNLWLHLINLIKIGFIEGLLSHRLRTILTMLGMIIGVSAVITMSSLSLGTNKKQINQIRELGANLIKVKDNLYEGSMLSNVRLSGSNGLSLADKDKIEEALPEIAWVSASREFKLNLKWNTDIINYRILGVTENYFEVNNLSLFSGRNFDHFDYSTGARVIIIGWSIKQQMNLDNPIDEILFLSGLPYNIVGVLNDKHLDTKELEATSISDVNYDVIAPFESLVYRTTHLKMRSQLDELHIQVVDEDSLYDAGVKLNRILELLHNGVRDFQIIIPLDLLKQKQQSKRLFNILTICISAISIVVGGIGIMNIMLASVTERTREIGIRRAVGATKNNIILQFLSESVLISVTGGFLGVLLSIILILGICHFIDIPFVLSLSIICVALFVAIFAGVVFGLYPAVEAAKKVPVEALRYE